MTTEQNSGISIPFAAPSIAPSQRPFARHSMSALDFGCGTGMVSRDLAPSLRQITAIDISCGMIDQLRARIAEFGLFNLRAEVHDLLSEPLEERFDLIYSAMALHHIGPTERLLDQLIAHLNPGGWIALADLDCEDGSFHKTREEFVHCGFEREQLIGALERRGFIECRAQTVHWVDKPTGTYSVFLITAQRP